MDRFFGSKIKNGEIGIDDVHPYWRTATEKWLADNS